MSVDIEKICAEKKLKLTAPRLKVFQTLSAFGKTLTAYEIAERMDNVKPMTVYRALDFLKEHGFVHRIESMNAFVVCKHDHCDHKDSQYLICENCKDVQELHNHALDHHIADELRSKNNFTVQKKSLEILGVCGNCQG